MKYVRESNVKAPKKGQSIEISFWYLMTGIVMIASVFSVVAVIIAVSFTNGQLKNYATKDDLNAYAKKDDLNAYTKNDNFDSSCDAWAKDKVVQYADSVQLQSTGTEQTGFLCNLQDGNAQFVNCGDIQDANDTINFTIFKETKGCLPPSDDS
tara:strand:- start:2823 stop:3281 length:459 start_codon:yes stop_codon:yes gene_type:complete